MTTWLTVREAQQYFKTGREQIKREARLAEALYLSENGGKYIIDAEALEEYRKAMRRA